MAFSDAQLSCDSFLDGKLEIWQPRQGYRAGIDPVLLAASINAKPGQCVLELGSGVGVASFCLARRVGSLDITCVELQSDYAELARKNAQRNGVDLTVQTANITDLPADLKARTFDHVYANPPYFHRGSGTSAIDAGRDIALAGETPLADWADVATRRLKPGGMLTIIQKSDRLGDLLAVLDHRLGSICVKPIAPRNARPAALVIVSARKGGRGAFSLLAPLVLHEGDAHTRDAESYTKTVKAILRDAAPLEMR